MTHSLMPQPLLGGLTFPEGPRWHEGKLWFSDFYTFRVMTVDLKGKAETVVDVPKRPSGLGWTLKGELLVVSMLDKRLWRFADGTLHLVADLSAFAGGPCNDMVVDAAGRAYVGNFGFDRHNGEAERPTRLVRVDPDGRITPVGDELLFPNGAVITPDGKTLIVGETLGHRLTAFDLGADGTLSRGRVWADLPGCNPDGICLDAEGAIWVADAWGHRAIRVLPGGKVAATVAMGERNAYACMLGGPDRRTLFLCTSTGSGPAMADKRDGAIEVVRVEVPGAGLP
jgi:sugar lactone lactonase YvrE